MLAIRIAASVFLGSKERPCRDTCSNEEQRPGACMRSSEKTNGRKRYTSESFHGRKKEAGVALAAFVTEVAGSATLMLLPII